MRIGRGLLNGVACRGKVALAACAIALLGAGAARAAVTIGPGAQSGAPGQVVEWQFAISGDDAANASILAFDIPDVTVDSLFEPVLKDPQKNDVDCSMSADLADRFDALTKWLGKSTLAVSFSRKATADPKTIGRAGGYMTCKIKIKDDAVSEQPIALGCENADVSDGDNSPLDATCEAGALTVGPALPTPTGTTGASPTPTATPTPSQYGGCSYSGEFTLPATNATAETDVTVALACSFDGKITGTETLVANAATTTLTCAGDCDTDTGELSNVECAEEGGGGPFAGCYYGEFSITSPVPTDIITDLECGNSGTITGQVQIVALAATVTCTGSCDTQTGVLSTVVCPTTTGGDLTISGTLPQPVGETATLTYVHSLLGTLNKPVENVACGGGSAISSEISGTLPPEGETGPLTFTLAGASTQQDVSNTECLAPPTPTHTPEGPTATPTTGGPVYTTKISESGCNITPNGGSGTPWALIIPAAALLVLRRRRG